MSDFAEAKALSFGYAAVGLAGVLTITAVAPVTPVLEIALVCFALGIPSAILAGLMFHLRARDHELSPGQIRLLHMVDWFALAAMIGGVAATIWHGYPLAGGLFLATIFLCLLCFVSFVALQKRKPAAEQTAADSPPPPAALSGETGEPRGPAS